MSDCRTFFHIPFCRESHGDETEDASETAISIAVSLYTMRELFTSWLPRTRHVLAATIWCLCRTALASYADVQFAGLEALYNSTNGPGWLTSTGWRDNLLGICNWYGVTCDSDSGNVTGLSLSSNELAGDVSEATELIEVSTLKELDLSNNRLSGSVPLVLGMMTHLETLDLSGNELSSFSDGWGSGASSLRHLSLQNNRISG